MKVDISHPSAVNRNYHLELKPETGNDQILLHFLSEDAAAPFSINADGNVEVVVAERETVLLATPVQNRPVRVISPAGKRRIAQTQKARWKKFRKLGKTPIKKAKTKKKIVNKVAKAAKGYWAKLSPKQRKEEVQRRKEVSLAKKRALAEVNTSATVIPTGVAI